MERCLGPMNGQRLLPEYPQEALHLKRSANVNVEFVFDAPDHAPQVHFLAPAPTDDFRDSVETYARQLRVPCLPVGAGAVTLRQGFDFQPNDGRKVAWTAPVDLADASRERALQCIEHPKGDDADIRYPDDMLRQRREQLVVARVHFMSGGAAPTSMILYDGGKPSFSKAVSHYLESMRVPCLPSGATVDTIVKFDFNFGNRKVRVLKDLSLPDYLAVVTLRPDDKVFFDTAQMKCPFDVRLTLNEPFQPNKVELLEEDVPARRPLADWLARQKLGLTPDAGAELSGQPMNIHIPCARIDL